MNEEQKQALETFKHWIEYEKNNKEKINKADELISMQECILGIIDKQQKEIKILKDNLVEERAFCKSTLETLKNCVDKDYLHKMISFKDGEIEKLKEAYQILKDDIEGHRIAYVDTPEFEENYISKDKIRKQIEEIKNCRLSTCDEQINKSLNERYEIEDEICEYFEELLGEK